MDDLVVAVVAGHRRGVSRERGLQLAAPAAGKHLIAGGGSSELGVRPASTRSPMASASSSA
jgi:hypothetical protein